MSEQNTNRLTHNNAAEFLIYRSDSGEVRVECLFKDETIWLTQKAIAELFDAERSVVTKHLRNIFKEGELVEKSVCAKFAHTAADGRRFSNPIEFDGFGFSTVQISMRLEADEGT